MFIGRREELEKLHSLFDTKESSFVAVYGRRRVGKTELVRQFCKESNLPKIEFSGTVDYNNRQQIKLFSKMMDKLHPSGRKLTDWIDAFELLKEYIDFKYGDKKVLVFFDELPWLDKPKSGFLGTLANFWNDYCTQKNNIILVICGSAASYMLRKVIHNKGSLHKRLTHIFPIQQFDLSATKEMLTEKKCRYSDKNIADIYIALGGVAKYLSLIDCNKTLNENMNQLCFKDSGLLKNEYEELYTSLFKNAKHHSKIMDILSSKWTGYTHKELADITGVSMVYIRKPVDELLASGFITATTKYNQKKRDVVYRATDCFSYFHNKWMKDLDIDDWGNIISSGSYNSWAGYAFENLCHMHIGHIKKILGISGVNTSSNYWAYKEKDKPGAQIDLMIEYRDRSRNIDIIECKYYNSIYAITKKYRDELQRKISVFNEQTNWRHNIRLIFITLNGIEKNEYYNELVNKDITLREILNTQIDRS